MGDRVVLETRDDDQLTSPIAAAHPSGGSHDAQSVGLGGTGGEDDLVHVGS